MPTARAVRDFPIETDEEEKVGAPAEAGGLNQQLETIERESLKNALRSASGNKSRAAKDLGLARGTFISKLKKWGLE